MNIWLIIISMLEYFRFLRKRFSNRGQASGAVKYYEILSRKEVMPR